MHDDVEVYCDGDEAAEEDELHEETADDEVGAGCKCRLCACSLNAAAWNVIVSRLTSIEVLILQNTHHPSGGGKTRRLRRQTA